MVTDFYNLKISEQNYNGAIDLYTQAIKKNWKNAVYFANRSISNLRLENFGYALNDASKAIELDKAYTKAYYRRAAAHMSLGKYKLALKDFEYVSISTIKYFKRHVVHGLSSPLLGAPCCYLYSSQDRYGMFNNKNTATQLVAVGVKNIFHRCS